MKSTICSCSVLLFAGCVVLETGPVSTDERPSARHESSVGVKRLDHISKRVRRDGDNVALVLSATGSFDVGYEQSVEVIESVKGRTGVGFFPWTYADRPGEKPVIDHIISIFVSYSLACTPVLYSWFFEPFSDYPANGVNDHVFAGFTVLGAYRYCAEPSVKRTFSRVDKSSVTKRVYRVEDFSVSHGGREYRSERGRIVLPIPYEVGMTVDARITSLNVPSEDLRLGIMSSECQRQHWRAGGTLSRGKRLTPEDDTVREPSPAAGCSSSRFFVGRWESFQSHKAITHIDVPGSKDIEINQMVHCTYEFFKDGAFREVMEISGKETLWTGQWQFADGRLRLKMKNQDGSQCAMEFNAAVAGSGEIGLRYADLAAYEKLIRKGDVKMVRTNYNDMGELKTSLEIESSGKDGKKVRTIVDSVYSPLVLERLERKN